MPIIYTDTSIFDSPAKVLACPVNTVGVMGKGLALEFKNRYPDMFDFYVWACENDALKMGEVLLWGYVDSEPDEKSVMLFPTKIHWRGPSKVEYIEIGLRKIVNSPNIEWLNDGVAFPALGCGLGGLDFESQVKPLMEKYLSDMPFDVYIHLPGKEL